MPAFPAELITLFGSSLLAGILGIFSKVNESRRMERVYTLQALQARAKLVDDARKVENRGFQWTRRLIALIAVFFVIAWPKIVAVLMPELPIHVASQRHVEGFLFFTSDHSRIQWEALQGITITPLDTHLLSAIIGLYFGGSLARS